MSFLLFLFFALFPTWRRGKAVCERRVGDLSEGYCGDADARFE